MEPQSCFEVMLALLRAGLWERELDDLSPYPLTAAQWWDVYHASVRQAVAALVCRGLHYLPAPLLPPDALMAHWVAKTDRTVRQNRQANAAVCRLVRLMRHEGLRPVLLKGQGVAALYERPLLRECGDIDLWFPSAREARAASALMRRAGCRTEGLPDGSCGYSWQGQEIEHHTRLFDLSDPMLRRRLASLTRQYGFAGLTLRGERPETDGGGEAQTTVTVPSPMLNLMLLNAHILKHLMGRGIGLRQFCDMARAYHALRGSYQPDRLAEAYRRTGLLRWSLQLHAFLATHIGLPDADLPLAAAGASVSPRLLHIVRDGGDFGRYATAGGRAATAMGRKAQTLLAFWQRRGFSATYAPKEAIWTAARLIIGNITDYKDKT